MVSLIGILPYLSRRDVFVIVNHSSHGRFDSQCLARWMLILAILDWMYKWPDRGEIWRPKPRQKFRQNRDVRLHVTF
jgi:hypothetical protein